MRARGDAVRWAVAVGAACLGGLAPGRARADGNDPAAMAETLFLSGRSLMSAGNYTEACPKFAESNKIDPKLGTLLNLALCHELAGLSASAWAEYTRAAEIAHRAGQADREGVAREHAATLERGLPHVIIKADAAAGATVTLDDQPIGPAAYGTPMPVDPGPHRLRAIAPGKAPYETTFRSEASTPDQTFEVPALSPAASSLSPSPSPSPGGGASRERPFARPPSSAQRTWGYVVGGIGLALVGAGSYLGVRAFSDKSTAEDNCSPSRCMPSGDAAKSSLATDELLSTVGVIAGLGAIATGGYLVITSGGGSSRAAPDGLSNAPAASARTPPVVVGIDLASRGVRAQWTW